MNTVSPKRPIIFCINELDVGGAEKALVRISTGLKRRGWDVEVVSLRDKGPLSKLLESEQIPVTALGCGGFTDVRCWSRLRRVFRQKQPQAVFSFLHQANVYSRLAALGLGVPIISGIRVADRRRWVILTDRLTSRFSDCYVAVSSAVAETHARLCRLPPGKMTTIPNGVEIPQSKPEQSRKSNELLFVGRLTPQKAPFDLLQAYVLLAEDEQLSANLTFVGDGELRPELEKTVADLGLQQQVSFAGQVDDVFRRMSESTLLVLPSLWEGMPNVVLEAMASGLPVVATSVDGTKDVIDDGRTGWLVQPGSPTELSTAISEALRSPNLRLEFAERAQTLVMEQFSWPSVVDRYEKLLRSLLAHGDKRTATEM